MDYPVAGKFVRPVVAAFHRPLSPYWLVAVQAGGVGLFFLLPYDPAVIWTIAACFLLAVILSAQIFWRRRLQRPVARYSLWAVAFLLLGYAGADLRERWVAAPRMQETRSFSEGQGRVIGLERTRKGARLLLDRLTLPGLETSATPERVRVTVRSMPEELRVGDRIQFAAQLSPPPGPAYPGAFDFAGNAWFQRLGGVGFTFGAPRILADRGNESDTILAWFRARIAAIRDGVAVRLRTILTPDHAAVATALSIGDRAGLSESIQEDLRHAGLAHLLAISGLHMGMVSGMLFFTFRAGLALLPGLALNWPIKKISAAGAIVGSLLYLLLSGANVSTVRAFIMVLLVFTAILLDRRALSMRTVAIAASILLVLTPEALRSPGFQMSFAAVIALIAFYEALALQGRDHLFRRGAFIFGIAATTLVAGLATAPFAMWHFQQWVNYGIVANLVAVPILSFATMPAILLSLLLMPFGLEYLMTWPLELSLSAILATAETVAGWPYAAVITPVYPDGVFIVLTLAGLWLCLEAGWRRWAALAVPLAVLLIASPEPAPDLFIGKDAKTIAVRLPDGGLVLSSGARRSFSTRAWLRRVQQSDPASPGEDAKRCDGLGCIYRAGNTTIAHSKDPRSLRDDCRLSDIVVASYPVRVPCEDPVAVIDLRDIRLSGPHSVLWRLGDMQIQSARDLAGRRRWQAHYTD